jgi:hypothetical protein
MKTKKFEDIMAWQKAKRDLLINKAIEVSMIITGLIKSLKTEN